MKRFFKSPIMLPVIVLVFGLAVGMFAQLQQSGGPTSNVSFSGALPAGSNTIGGIDVIDGAGGTNKLGVNSSGQLTIANSAFGISGSIPAGSNTIGGVNVATALPAGANTIGGVNIASSLPAGSNTIGNVGLSAAIPAGTNVIGSVFSIPKTACGGTVASQALAAVPTSTTAVFTSTTCITVIVMNNTTGTQLTVSVSDDQGSPTNDILTFAVPPNSQLIQPLYGVQFTSGLKWSASATGVTGAVLGMQ